MFAARPRSPRPHPRTPLLLLLLPLLLAAPGCDDGDDPNPQPTDATTPDAARDPDADPNPDADAPPDADSNPDADPNPDATPDQGMPPPDEGMPDPDAAPRPPLEGPLADYVAAPDDAYAWAIVDEDQNAGYRAFRLRVDSQNWRTLDEVDRTLWTHTVTLVIPSRVDTTTALIVISGDRNREDIRPLDPGSITIPLTLANQARAPVALIEQIPNQPLTFTDVGEPYSEDALVAWTWRRTMDTGDYTWPAYLPMVKGTVRSMDAIQEFATQHLEDIRIDDFIVTGFSKRGATAWLTAAVDDRVRAVAPGVFDVLHMEEQISRHYGAYGFYSAAIDDYVEQGVIEMLGTPEAAAAVAIVDPITYADRLTMPKLVLAAGGDEFFLPDAAQLFLDDLPGETHYRQFPNTGHGLDNAFADVIATVVTFFRAIVDRTPRPQVTFTRNADTLTVTGTPRPISARLWTVTNPTARDFRHPIVGEDAWTATPLEIDPTGTTTIPLLPPEAGFTAYMVDMTFDIAGRDHTHGTPSFIAPDVFPFADAAPDPMP